MVSLRKIYIFFFLAIAILLYNAKNNAFFIFLINKKNSLDVCVVPSIGNPFNRRQR